MTIPRPSGRPCSSCTATSRVRAKAPNRDAAVALRAQAVRLGECSLLLSYFNLSGFFLQTSVVLFQEAL
jgi:hypothetical protein